MGSISTDVMTEQEARRASDLIAKGCNKLQDLVFEFHERRGYEALGYDSFTEWVKAEIPLSKAYVDRLIKAKRIESNVNPCQSTTGATPIGVAKIKESHARELGKLPDDQQAEAYEEAVAVSEGKPTAATVKAVVERRLTEQPDPEDEEPDIVDGLGQVVPDDLHAVFLEGDSILAGFQAEVRSLRKRLKEFTGQPGSDYLNIQQTDLDLRNVSEALKFARPYALTPEGVGCKYVEIGWITKAQYNNLPPEFRTN